MKKISHIGVAVADIKESSNLFSKIFNKEYTIRALNEKKHVLWRGNFKAGLDLLDLIQLFLGLEEKVKIGPHNFHLYLKKSYEQ